MREISDVLESYMIDEEPALEAVDFDAIVGVVGLAIVTALGVGTYFRKRSKFKKMAKQGATMTQFKMDFKKLIANVTSCTYPAQLPVLFKEFEQKAEYYMERLEDLNDRLLRTIDFNAINDKLDAESRERVDRAVAYATGGEPTPQFTNNVVVYANQSNNTAANNEARAVFKELAKLERELLNYKDEMIAKLKNMDRTYMETDLSIIVPLKRIYNSIQSLDLRSDLVNKAIYTKQFDSPSLQKIEDLFNQIVIIFGLMADTIVFRLDPKMKKRG